MSLKRVLVVNKTFPKAGLDLLKNRVQTTLVEGTDDQLDSLDRIKRSIAGCDAVIWNTKHKLTAEILDLAGPQLRAISTMASGVDHIDVEAVRSRGIPLGNTPKVLDNAVADITVGLLVAAARRFKEGVEEITTGEWKFGVQWMIGQDITGSTVGVVGLGGVGRAVVRRLAGFDVKRFLYSGRTDKPEAKALNVERVPLDTLLRESDYVILSCPLTAETKNLINADSLRTMKRNCVIVNIARGGWERTPLTAPHRTSRLLLLDGFDYTLLDKEITLPYTAGGLVDQDALYEALKERRIFAAGLDVVTPEPMEKDHKLLTLPNCYVIPHMGSATIKTRNDMAMISARNVLLGLEGKTMEFPAY